MKPFDEYPLFYVLDNRKKRPIFPITKEVLEKKYESVLAKDLIFGKTILDLGSCLGARGQHSIFYGAKHYTGVEIQKRYFLTSKKILTHYSDKISLYNLSIENFLSENRSQYDVVAILGVLYCFVDYFSILKGISLIGAEYIIIESMYIDGLGKENFTKSMVEILNNQTINLSGKDINKNTYISGFGSRTSPKALIDLMYILGYSFDKIILPEKIVNTYDPYNSKLFNNKDRYILRFKKGNFGEIKDLSGVLNSI